VCFSLLVHRDRLARRQELDQPSSRSNGQMHLSQAVEILVARNISSAQSLSDPTSPQHMALSWLVLEDTEQVDVDSAQFIQRYALAVLYFAWGGSDWYHSCNFLSSLHECSWSESMDDEDGAALAIGVTCDQDSQVQGLNLGTFFHDELRTGTWAGTT